MGIRSQECVDSITMALLSANCFDIFEKKYKNKNEFKLELKKKLLRGSGRETLETFEGEGILKTIFPSLFSIPEGNGTDDEDQSTVIWILGIFSQVIRQIRLLAR